jgi:hypothetical protein
MKYAGKSYGGQVASVGRIVVVRLHGQLNHLQSAIIDRVQGNGVPFIRLHDGTICAGEENAEHITPLQFVPTKTPEEIDNLPKRSWTWPVRV